MGGALALFDLGNEPRELDRPPYGVNMAVRKGIFEKYGGFRIDLGPTPDGRIPRANEDTELGRRLMAAGERLKYEPSAVVYHPIPADRLKRKYFLRWHFDYGRAQIRERGERPPVWVIPRQYFSIPRILGIQLSTRVVRWMFTLNPERRFFWKSWVWMTVGEVVEIPRVVRDVKKKREKALKRENVDCKAEV